MQRRGTRIVATISPATVRNVQELDAEREVALGDTKAALSALAQAGVDVFRLNMSFRNDTFTEHVLSWFRDEEEGDASGVALLGDLQGPKLRFGAFETKREAGSPGSEAAGVGQEDGKTRLVRGEEFLLYFREDPAHGVELTTPGDGQRGTVLLNDDFYEVFGDCVKRGLANGPVEIAVGDGNTLLRVENKKSVRGTHVITRVEVGGVVASHKGVMPRRTPIDVPSVLTGKDRDDLRFLLRRGGRHLSFVAMSFVKTPADIIELREEIESYRTFRAHVNRRIRDLGADGERAAALSSTLLPAVVAKIETREAVKPDALDSILDLSDAVMVARGDLALQMDPDQVPRQQKEIISTCRMRGKPVITATQMLHSMQFNPRPTRSEVNDVFNAALDGTDATMLSGETAGGAYPIESVETMANILSRAEEYWHSCRSDLVAEWADVSRSLSKIVEGAGSRLTEHKNDLAASLRGRKNARKRALAYRLYDEKLEKTSRQPTTDMISMSAWAMVSAPEIVAIVAVTASGRTARMLARLRPDVPVFAVTHDDENRRKLLLSFGVLPVEVDVASTSGEEVYSRALEAIERKGWLRRASRTDGARELAVFVSGTPMGDPGTTNQLRLVSLSDAGYTVEE